MTNRRDRGMKLEDFLKCKHRIDTNTSMTGLYCQDCGVDASVITYCENLQYFLKVLVAGMRDLTKAVDNEDWKGAMRLSAMSKRPMREMKEHLREFRIKKDPESPS